MNSESQRKLSGFISFIDRSFLYYESEFLAYMTKMCLKSLQLSNNHYLCSIYIFMAKNLLLLWLKIEYKTWSS